MLADKNHDNIYISIYATYTDYLPSFVDYLNSKPSNPIEGTFVRPYLRKSLRFLFLITDKGYILRTKVSFVHTKHFNITRYSEFSTSSSRWETFKIVRPVYIIAVRDKFLAKFEP